jgi:hypothetical protein
MKLALFIPLLVAFLVFLELTIFHGSILQPTENYLQPFPIEQPLCVIARTYPDKFDYLATFLMSMSQNSIPPKIFLVVTDTSNDKSKSINVAQKHVDFVNNFLGYKLSEIVPIDEKEVKDLNPNYKTDFGYAYTDAVINKLLLEREKHKCKYLLITNGDNLYRKQFFDDYLSAEMANQVDMIGFNFITHHARFPTISTSREKDDGRNHELRVEFTFAWMDLGACFFKFDFFEKYDDLRFVKMANLRGGDFFNCDGILIESAHKRSNSSMIIRDVLYFHQ